MYYKLGMLPITLLFVLFCVNAQSVSIKEETLALDTYGFSEPNPVPILTENPKITPYYKFEAYEHESSKRNWKVVTLENEYIKVFVLPEIGGKVWGAIEKSTGEEFLYKNEVVKFRNIAMRGPWTSGGIEFNFGIIGHHPSTATPVDYLTRKNGDGSVSCIVGNTDLPSNTRWTVEIRLEKGKAYFETNASWYNASPLSQSYYNWMTAAAAATYDLEFFIPGDKYVEHGGNAHPWPIDDKGRNLALYKNNTFGPSKSYHVVGEYNDFFGGYYPDKKFGFGTWAPYEEMPGQKLWLWNLSRAGGIWEDLLTDSDGQYIEFQAGRLFDQYSPGRDTNPITQVGFDPYVMDTWSEIWFPYKEIGGMKDASKEGVLNVTYENGKTFIGINALQKLDNEILVTVNDEIVLEKTLNLEPMGVFLTKLTTVPDDRIEVRVKGTDLGYINDSGEKLLKRPFYPDENLKISESEKLLQEGLEAIEFREFSLAREKLSELIILDPSHRKGLIGLAELEYRRADYEMALKFSNTVLKMDTYDPSANYMAGLAYRAIDDHLNALESLGWAARDMKYRSVSFAQMAEIYLVKKNYERARTYAEKALAFNTYNVNAREVLMEVSKFKNERDNFNSQIDEILKIDPLNHFAQLERIKINGNSNETKAIDLKTIQNEFKHETLLDLAIRYHQLGLDSEALSVLPGTKNVKNLLWAAYLQKDTDPNESGRLLNDVIGKDINLTFPYRRETLPVMEWAIGQNNSWKLKHYLAHNFLAVGQEAKGKSILKGLENDPDSNIFYRFRAALMKEAGFDVRAKDYEKALKLKPSDWKIWEEYIQFLLQNEKYEEAYNLSKKAFKRYRRNYNIELAHAKAALNTGHFSEVIKIMETIQVLPYEHASESRKIYERAYLGVARTLFAKKKYKAAITVLEKSKEWPENIGVGKPYEPDERIQDYVLAVSYEAIGETDKSKELLQNVVDYSNDHLAVANVDHLFGLLALRKLDRQDKLAPMISKLKSENPKNLLALALFENDDAAMKTQKVKTNIPEDIWKVLLTVIQ